MIVAMAVAPLIDSIVAIHGTIGLATRDKRPGLDLVIAMIAIPCVIFISTVFVARQLQRRSSLHWALGLFLAIFPFVLGEIGVPVVLAVKSSSVNLAIAAYVINGLIHAIIYFIAWYPLIRLYKLEKREGKERPT
jgi:hypothetical protein